MDVENMLENQPPPVSFDLSVVVVVAAAAAASSAELGVRYVFSSENSSSRGASSLVCAASYLSVPLATSSLYFWVGDRALATENGLAPVKQLRWKTAQLVLLHELWRLFPLWTDVVELCRLAAMRWCEVHPCVSLEIVSLRCCGTGILREKTRETRVHLARRSAILRIALSLSLAAALSVCVSLCLSWSGTRGWAIKWNVLCESRG